MKQWQTRQDGIDHLQLVSVEQPQLEQGQVLVQVRAVSLNYRDTEVVMGLYTHHKTTHPNSKPEAIVPCSDMCGQVVASKSSKWNAGDRVMSTFTQTHVTGTITAADMQSGLGWPLPGVLTEYRVFPEYGLAKVPDYLTDEEAATLPIATCTAWMSINGFRSLGQPGGKGETVLIQGTGGVAIAGLQIAKASGATVIITSSSDAKLQQAQALGADHVINYRSTPDWQQKVLELTDGQGADCIFETGGSTTLRKSFACVKFGGLINCIGYLSGKADAPGDRTNTNVLALMRNVTLKGILNGPRDRLEEAAAFYAQHEIHPVVDKVFSFEEAKEALHYLFSGSHFGKVVIKV